MTDNLLQNETKVYYKMRPGLKCDSFLQIVKVITKYINFITKCDSYFKMQRSLQNASVQTVLKNIKMLYVYYFKKAVPHSHKSCITDSTSKVIFFAFFCVMSCWLTCQIVI